MNLSAYTHTHAHTYSYTVHFGSPPSNRELQVRRVAANRKAGIEGVKRKHGECRGEEWWCGASGEGQIDTLAHRTLPRNG